MVVWTRSLVGFDMPGHRNSGPVVDVIGGRRPGTSVVRAWTMRDVVGPKLQLAPQPSAAVARAGSKATSDAKATRSAIVECGVARANMYRRDSGSRGRFTKHGAQG